MNVTRDNFEEALVQLSALLKQSQFVAIDCEFTGVRLESQPQHHLFDRASQRYQNAKEVAEQFLPLQVGICPFVLSQNQWHAYPFNFYTFPHTDYVPGLHAVLVEFQKERAFSVQASSLAFLIRNGFDLNLAIRKGIGWVSREDEHMLSETYDGVEVDEYRRQAFDSGMIPPDLVAIQRAVLSNHRMNPRDTAFLQTLAADVHDWLLFHRGVTGLPHVRTFHARCDEHALHLSVPVSFPYYRVMIKDFLDQHFPMLHLDCNDAPSWMPRRFVPMCIREPTSPERQALATQRVAARRTRFQEQLRDRAGFRRVIDVLSESRVPLVGHNGLLDLSFLVHHFLHPLPDSFVEFKKLVHEVFPAVFDTKYVCNSERFATSFADGTTICKAINQIAQQSHHAAPRTAPPLVLCAPGVFSRYGDSLSVGKENALLHEAGYDAFLTGTLILRLMYMYNPYHQADGSIGAGWCSDAFTNAYANRLYLWNSQTCIHLATPDESVESAPLVCVE